VVKEEISNILEDKDIGHQDNEPDMLKKTALEVMEYGKKLHDALDKYDDMDTEVDFPNWWQSKLILSKDYLQKAYHYLDSEEKTESVNEAIEPSGIMAKISKIVQDKQAMKISGVLMDMFSAGIMMRIYNAVNDKSKEQMNKGTMRQVQVILHKVMKQNKVTK
jgi:hypothetical protein